MLKSTRNKGFTLLELIVVVILIGILMISAMERMLRLQVDAERVSMMQVLGSLQSAINIEVAYRVLKRGLSSIGEMQDTNPMDYLGEKPFNYRGETTFYRSKKNLSDASWYFDTTDNTLVYRVKNRTFFSSNNKNNDWASFKVDVIYRERVGTPVGIKIRDIDHYQWK